jgi:hypothetical protein
MDDQGLQTICAYCIFAEWHDFTDDDYTHKEQIGCYAGVLDKFKCKHLYNIDNIDLDIQAPDAETAKAVAYCQPVKELSKSYYIIHDRVCLYNRPEEWREHHGNLPLDDLLKLVRKEIQIKVTALIYYDNDNTLANLQYSFKTLENGNVKPSEIIVLYNKPLTQPHKAIQQIHQVSGSVPYRIEFVQEPDADFYRCFDIGLKKAKCTFTAGFHAGQTITNNFLQELDTTLNDSMRKFVLVKPINEHGHQLVVQTMIGKIVGGNNPVFDGDEIFLDNIIGKIEHLAEKQECRNMII